MEHAPFAPLSRAEDVLGERAELLVVRVHAGDVVPTGAGNHDAVIVLGGPQSAYTDAGFPTRQAELALVRDALARSVPYLGICLGAQLLAVAAGGEGYQGDVPEVGWQQIRHLPACETDPLHAGVPEAQQVLESHSDHVTLPAGATLLATNGAYPNQAFRVGERAWGFQYHLEAGSGFMRVRKALLTEWREAQQTEDDPLLHESLRRFQEQVLGRFMDVVEESTLIPAQRTPAALPARAERC